jgi:hypothetical protein
MEIKVKGKFETVHVKRAYGGSEGIAPLIINIGTRWR